VKQRLKLHARITENFGFVLLLAFVLRDVGYMWNRTLASCHDGPGRLLGEPFAKESG
jgi:hypothetical protein